MTGNVRATKWRRIPIDPTRGRTIGDPMATGAATIRIRHLVIACVVLLASLTACVSAREKAFLDVIDTDVPINESLRLELLTDLEQTSDRVTIDLLLENKSTQMIAFPADYGARIFVYLPEVNEWQEIENGVTYLPEDELRVLEPGDDIPFNQTVLGVWPRTDTDLENALIRVLVTGFVLRDGEPTSEQKVAVAEFTWPDR